MCRRQCVGGAGSPVWLRSCMRRTPAHPLTTPLALPHGSPGDARTRDGSIGALESLFQAALAAVHASLQLDAAGRGASIHLSGTGTLEAPCAAAPPLPLLAGGFPPFARARRLMQRRCTEGFLALRLFILRAVPAPRPFSPPNPGYPGIPTSPPSPITHHPSTPHIHPGHRQARPWTDMCGLPPSLARVPTLDMLDRGPILPGPEPIHILGLLPGFCTFHDGINSRNCPSTNKAGGPFPIQFRYYACQRCGSAPARSDWSSLPRCVIWRLLRR